MAPVNPNLLQSKRCSRCKLTLRVTEFNRKVDGWQSRCRACSAWIQLEIRYNITQVEYEALLTEQGGACAICKNPEPRYSTLSVDHCHGTNRVRGLLCSNCNPMIGYAADNPEVLRDAALYLERQ